MTSNIFIKTSVTGTNICYLIQRSQTQMPIKNKQKESQFQEKQNKRDHIWEKIESVEDH